MPLPIYLYTGPELGDRNAAVDAVKNNLKKKFSNIDEHLFYLLETPFSQVMTILQSGTLFSDGVCVVCKNAELLKKKDELEMISDWLETKPDDTQTLILVSDEISVDAKLDKLVPSSNKKKCWEMFDSDKLPWIYNFFSKNGYHIEEEAAQLILDLVENNKQALTNECSRFFVCFPKNHTITEEDVDSVISHTREENAFTLFNHIANPSETAEKRFEDSLEILQKIRLSKENSSVMIIAGLTSCFRKLILWNNEGESAISGKMMQNQYRKAAKIWTTGQATAILANLAAVDMEIRSGGSQMEDVLLEKMLYEIVVKKGGRIAAYESTQL